MRGVVLMLVACSSAPALKPATPGSPDPQVQRLFPLELAPRPELTAAFTFAGPPVAAEAVPVELAAARAVEHCARTTLLASDERDPCEQALCDAGHHSFALALAAEARCAHATAPHQILLAAVLANEPAAAVATALHGEPRVEADLAGLVAAEYRGAGRMDDADQIDRTASQPPDPLTPCRRMIEAGRTIGDPDEVIRLCAGYARADRGAVPAIALAAAYFGWPRESIPPAARWLEIARIASKAQPARDAAALELAALGNAAQVAMCRDHMTVDAIRDLATSFAEAVPADRAAAEAIAARPCAYR